jgi:hypothetical protein
VARRPASPRGLRRLRARGQAKLAREQEELARLQPGGAPGRPLAVESPAQVEVRAGATPCPLCSGPLHVVEHVARTVDGVHLRVARTRCTGCGVARELYFRLAPPALH